MNGELPIRVMKLGGSLLNRVVDERQASSNFMAWHQESPTASHDVLITGGGQWADSIRRLDESGSVSAVAAHWLAIRAMSLTAWLFAQLEPSWTYVSSPVELMTRLKEHLHNGQRIVFDSADWLRAEEREQLPDRLPIGWQVTSDSIAAHLAKRIQASELVLLKSTDAPASDVSVWKQQAIVDDYFAHAAGAMPVTIVNLRPRVSGGTKVVES